METGTLEELNVKPGDVVAWHKAAKGYEWQEKNFSGTDDWVVQEDGGIFSEAADDGFGGNCNHIFRIISRASDEPKLWRDMTDAEKGALLLAYHEGKVIEYYYHVYGWKVGRPKFLDWCAYRIKPAEPVRETVTLHGRKYVTSTYPTGVWDFDRNPEMDGDTHRITFDLIDGKPDCDSIKMEEL